MESDSFYGERFSIRDSAKSLKKYGSTCNHVRNSTSNALIRHDVLKSDTLAGIALKYGCTTEHLRRSNRLYASDSLFSRPFLMVPVEKGSPYYPTEEAGASSSSAQRPHSMPSYAHPQRIVSMDVAGTSSSSSAWDPLQAPGPSSSHSMDFYQAAVSSSTNATARPEELSPEEEQKKNLDELMDKIDSTIAQSRRFVAKSQDSRDLLPDDSDYPDGVADYDGAYQNYPGSSSGHMRNASGSSFHTTDDTSSLITNSRQVKSSLQRLERTQDELFEL